ncbi:flagellar biosynthesis protein FlhS [Desulfuribacillus stibiiarsenatis]|uniref:Flagellar biosynthesis protein FlhS n=1 Tax=Desulfuribacillus stibiiarsenatis TaxID=1390249 RepID=A0A1E5L9U3_9FIRM|nr:EscU/YscU/HrcU family type III secretion system export apparatus switch protein [Desulfuribacillus stibiiarsenatis]OEH86789.1 flagellar biosynthesis protein FlhS [Desulfuribacillus stibiiarsenatis]
MMQKWFNQKKKRELSGPSAVALQYKEGEDDKPVVIAHGRGAVAQRILDLAKENDVPMQEDASLVSDLIDMDLGSSVPPQLYHVIAEVLIMLEEIENS